MKRVKYAICAVYDTETCNVGCGSKTRAYPILFIDNDIRDINLYEYKEERDDKVSFYRHETEYIDRLHEYIAWGHVCNCVPIVCAYNLMFDLQPLMELLSNEFEIRANAQSSTNVYTLDLCEEESERVLLRFWDTFHLEMRGLKAMGETCGLVKATGDWDYSLTRTPDTPLTELEYYYAARDTQVIPAYLRYLLHANEWMRQDELGVRVLTKTSIVRQMARHNIAPIVISKRDGKKLKLDKAFESMCIAELPKSFSSYALRKGCFRGGFTFTSARYASVVVRNVASLDVTSMHHTFINGRYVPTGFRIAMPSELEKCYQLIVNTTRDELLARYHKPFDYAFHARIRFRTVRLRKGTCFDEWGIALSSTAKFKRVISAGNDVGTDPRNVAQENEVRREGWHDTYTNARFALGKLYAADEVVMHLTELELWAFSRVYEWDSHECVFGEVSGKWKIPPDYVTLQSNLLFEMKNDAKRISKTYKEGVPYMEYIPSTIPDGIADMLRDGTCTEQFFESWYTSTVKGMFNGIYGTMAQDVYKPSYKCVDGELVVDRATVTTKENWEERQPKRCKVLYTYGMRIVGGSRVHLVIAMELLFEALGNRVRVCGGDTDSMKVSCDDDVTDDELQAALEPLAVASKMAMDTCMKRMREQHPDMASQLTGIGSFDVEGCGDGTRWAWHMDAWNKARISMSDGRCHITCAGLSRPEGSYTIEMFVNDLVAAGHGIADVFQLVLGYNVTVGNQISHSLEGHHPSAHDVFDNDVTDYLGNISHVTAHESNALYPTPRVLGETAKPTNMQTVRFLRDRYGRDVDTSQRYLVLEDGMPLIQRMGDCGMERVMSGGNAYE